MDDFVVIVLYSFLNFLNVLYGSAVLGHSKNGVCVCAGYEANLVCCLLW